MNWVGIKQKLRTSLLEPNPFSIQLLSKSVWENNWANPHSTPERKKLGAGGVKNHGLKLNWTRTKGVLYPCLSRLLCIPPTYGTGWCGVSLPVTAHDSISSSPLPKPTCTSSARSTLHTSLAPFYYITNDCISKLTDLMAWRCRVLLLLPDFWISNSLVI